MNDTSWANMTPAIPSPLTPEAQARSFFYALSPDAQTKRRDELLQQWRKEQEALEAAKAAEMKTRIEIVAILFDPASVEGTETLNLGAGWKIKAQKKLNYTLGDSRADPKFVEVEAALDTIESLPDIPEAGFVAERLVRWKPELTLKEYRQLATEPKYAPIKAIIDRVLTAKPGAPSLELIEPEGVTKQAKRRK